MNYSKLEQFRKKFLFCNNKDRKILSQNFYSRDTSLVAKELLGKVLIKKYGNNIISGIITETEAYYGQDDPASHAYRGKTSRAKIMFGKAGIAYVYFCYGMYYLLNAVTEEEDVPGAVLLRGVIPLEGIQIMQERRKKNKKNHSSNSFNDKNCMDSVGKFYKLTGGPGKITVAFGINNLDNGKNLTDIKSDLAIYNYFVDIKNFEIICTQRVGISKGKDKYLRFLLK